MGKKDERMQIVVFNGDGESATVWLDGERIFSEAKIQTDENNMAGVTSVRL